MQIVNTLLKNSQLWLDSLFGIWILCACKQGIVTNDFKRFVAFIYSLK